MENEKIYEELINDRKKLLDLNNQINSVGNKISFWKFLIVPLLISMLITALAKYLGANSSQSIGLMIISFTILMAINTIRSKKQIEKEKALLIKQRMALQKEIVEKTKKLKDK